MQKIVVKILAAIKGCMVNFQTIRCSTLIWEGQSWNLM